MNDIHHFAKYAETFERVYINDDWQLLVPHFHEDAVYETIADSPLAGVQDGRDAILAGLKQSLDKLDRRFEKRILKLLDGPHLQDGAVRLDFRATYQSSGLPDLVLEGRESLWFEDGRIKRMEDRYTDAQTRVFADWMQAHADRLP